MSAIVCHVFTGCSYKDLKKNSSHHELGLPVFVLNEIGWELFRNLAKPYNKIKPPTELLGPDYMSRADPVSRAASVCRDDFQSGITWGEPAQLMADAMNHRRPERARVWCDQGLMSRAGLANAITWKTLSPVSRDPTVATAIPGSWLTRLARLSCTCNRKVDFYGI